MSDSFFPITSDSPPPLDFDDEDNGDDDFTDFTAGGEWAVDNDTNSFDCPLPEKFNSNESSPIKLPISDKLSQKSSSCEDFQKFSCESEVQDQRSFQVTEESLAESEAKITFRKGSGPTLLENSNVSYETTPTIIEKLSEVKTSDQETDSKVETGLDSSKIVPFHENAGLFSATNTVTACKQNLENKHLHSAKVPSLLELPQPGHDGSSDLAGTDHHCSEVNLDLPSGCELEGSDFSSDVNVTNGKTAKATASDYTSTEILCFVSNNEPNSSSESTSGTILGITTNKRSVSIDDITSDGVELCTQVANGKEGCYENTDTNIVVNDEIFDFVETLDNFVDEAGEKKTSHDTFDAFHSCAENETANEGFADFSAFAPNSVPEVANLEVDGCQPDVYVAEDLHPFSASAFPCNKATEYIQVKDKHDTIEDESDDFADFQMSSEGFSAAAEEDEFGGFESVVHTTDGTNGCLVADVSSIPSWFPCTVTNDGSESHIPIDSQLEDDVLPVFTDVSDTRVRTSLHTKELKRPSQLWDCLEDIDNAVALKFGWNDSSHHQQLLASLGIETQNILFGRSSKPYYVPTYYAAGLGLLEPGNDVIKPVSAAEKITAVSPKEKLSAMDDSQVWKIETGTNHVASSNSACAPAVDSNGAGGGVDSFAYPCASDLSAVNLDMLNAPSVNGSVQTSSSEQDKVDPELLELAMNVTPDLAAKRPDPFSKILASFGVNPAGKKSQGDDEDLSDDAKKLLKKLPQLSFMRSNVLMFPVGKSVAHN